MLEINEVPVYSKQTLSSCVDIEDLVNDTGFTPKILFEEGIEHTIEYFREKMEDEILLSICIPTYI